VHTTSNINTILKCNRRRYFVRVKIEGEVKDGFCEDRIV
jgi:hypothetical protein